MKIHHEENETKGRFYIGNQQAPSAELTYSKAGTERIIIDHTEVSDEHRGEGLGKSLVFHAVEYARNNQLKILPLCPYARTVFLRHPELRDVS